MNKTSHGRWGRYRVSRGEKQKLCNGPMHDPITGAWLPLRSFWIVKKGKRAGKPMSRCSECEKTARGRDPKKSGLIRVTKVWWIFAEIQARIGKTEACRRLGVSHNMWYRAEKGIYYNVRRGTVAKAVELLAELRREGVVRHKDSIRHGAHARGKEEKIPKSRRDFYRQTYSDENEARRKHANQVSSEKREEMLEKDRKRKQKLRNSVNQRKNT